MDDWVKTGIGTWMIHVNFLATIVGGLFSLLVGFLTHILAKRTARASWEKELELAQAELAMMLAIKDPELRYQILRTKDKRGSQKADRRISEWAVDVGQFATTLELDRLSDALRRDRRTTLRPGSHARSLSEEEWTDGLQLDAERALAASYARARRIGLVAAALALVTTVIVIVLSKYVFHVF